MQQPHQPQNYYMMGYNFTSKWIWQSIFDVMYLQFKANILDCNVKVSTWKNIEQSFLKCGRWIIAMNSNMPHVLEMQLPYQPLINLRKDSNLLITSYEKVTVDISPSSQLFGLTSNRWAVWRRSTSRFTTCLLQWKITFPKQWKCNIHTKHIEITGEKTNSIINGSDKAACDVSPLGWECNLLD